MVLYRLPFLKNDRSNIKIELYHERLLKNCYYGMYMESAIYIW